MRTILGLSRPSNQVYYFCENDETNGLQQEDILEAGQYITYTFKGIYDQIPFAVEEIKQYIVANNLSYCYPIFQNYIIDFNDTNYQNEYCTRIEMLIK